MPGRRRRPARLSLWQSFADLAMGLMAVFALVLVMLLWTQSEKNEVLASQKGELQSRTEALEEAKARLEEEKAQLELQRSRFAVELLNILRVTQATVEAQDGAETWIRGLFADEGCPLEMGEDGTLRRISSKGGAADLYQPGETRLNPEGVDALRRCQRSFVRLAYCLSPGDESVGAIERAKVCADAPSIESLDPTEQAQIAQLRQGLEALVLQGNTDRTSPGGLGIPAIRDAGGSEITGGDSADNFAQNAHLGAERARQALGLLLSLVSEHDRGPSDALEVLMARVRVESASFGRYQAGPEDWRETGCEAGEASCDVARNLSLKVRWKKRELRAPYEEIRGRLCELLADDESALSQGISTLLHAPQLVEHLNIEASDWVEWIESGTLTSGALRGKLGCASAEETRDVR